MTYTLADKGLNTTIDVRDLNTGIASRHGMSSQARRDWRRRRIIDERSKPERAESATLSRPTSSLETALDYLHRCRKKLPVSTAAFRAKVS